MALIEVPSRSVSYLDGPMSLEDIAQESDPISGKLTHAVRLSLNVLLRRERDEQFGALAACAEALGGRELPGVEMVGLLGVMGPEDLLIELVLDARTVFWTVEYDLAHNLIYAWPDTTAEKLRRSLELWRDRDQRPGPNPIR